MCEAARVNGMTHPPLVCRSKALGGAGDVGNITGRIAIMVLLTQTQRGGGGGEGHQKSAIYKFDSFPPKAHNCSSVRRQRGRGGGGGVVLVLGPELLTLSSDNLEWPFLSRLAVVLVTDLCRMPS